MREPEAGLGFGQQVDETGRGKEPHLAALLAGQEPQGRGQMGFAGAAVAHEDQVLLLVQVTPLGQVQDPGLVEGGQRREAPGSLGSRLRGRWAQFGGIFLA